MEKFIGYRVWSRFKREKVYFYSDTRPYFDSMSNIIPFLPSQDSIDIAFKGCVDEENFMQERVFVDIIGVSDTISLDTARKGQAEFEAKKVFGKLTAEQQCAMRSLILGKKL